MSFYLSSHQTANVMANCRRCHHDVGCDCNLVKGLCKMCYYKLQAEVGENNIEEELRLSCEQTLDSLNRLLEELRSRPLTNQLIRYQISIVRSQIKQFQKDPCAYKEIIDNIK